MIELLPLTLFVFYIIPFMVAAGRDHPAMLPILFANLLLGWTVIGWWAVFVWALVGTPNRSSVGSAMAPRAEARPRILHHM